MDIDNLYFHFTGDELRDGRPIPAIGEWLIHPRYPEICRHGLHASKHPMDALKYAPGTQLHLVELRDITDTQDDKVVAIGRKIIATIDSTDLLLRSSRKFASDVLYLWDAPAVVKQFLIDGSNPVAARDAAWHAAWDAARDAANAAWHAARHAANAAWHAARHAARDAARDAARHAARDAANAAWHAAWHAARHAARDAARHAARDAAWHAAWDAARDAARHAARDAANAAGDAQREYFLQQVLKEFRM